MQTLKDKIQFDKKLKNKWKIYYFILLILSNLIIFLYAKTDIAPETHVSSIEKVRSGYTNIQLNLKSNLSDHSFAPNESREIYLVDLKGNIIIKNAVYLRRVINENTESTFFEIEISNDEYIKLIHLQTNNLILIKANQYRLHLPSKSKGDKYEMAF